MHRVMIEGESLLEALEHRNWKSSLLTHVESLCHSSSQTWRYPAPSNLWLIWDAGDLLSMGSPSSSKKITVTVIGAIMTFRWLEAHGGENNRK